MYFTRNAHALKMATRQPPPPGACPGALDEDYPEVRETPLPPAVGARISGETFAPSEALRRCRALARLETSSYPPPAAVPHAIWRTQIVKWYGNLAAAFTIESETLSVATSLLDRYVAAKAQTETVSARDFKLCAVAAIYVAFMMQEPRPFRLSDCAALSDAAFDEAAVAAASLDLCQALEFNLNPPTVDGYLFLLGPFAGVPAAAAARAAEYLPLIRSDAGLATSSPSMLAVAALLVALRFTGAPAAATANVLGAAAAAKLPYAAATPDAAGGGVASVELLACGHRIRAFDDLLRCDSEIELLNAASDDSDLDSACYDSDAPDGPASSPTSVAAAHRALEPAGKRFKPAPDARPEL